MTPVFLDTVGLIAVWDDSDQWHRAAEPIWLDLLRHGRPFVTTPLVLYECGNAASRRRYRNQVASFRDLLQAAGGVVEPTPDELHTAWLQYAAEPVGGPGIVDLVSFAIMRRIGITEAFTNDKHFTTAGFVCLF